MSEIGLPVWSCSSESVPPALQTAAFSLCSPLSESKNELFGVCSYKNTNPIIMAPPFRPPLTSQTSIKALSPNTATLWG